MKWRKGNIIDSLIYPISLHLTLKKSEVQHKSSNIQNFVLLLISSKLFCISPEIFKPSKLQVQLHCVICDQLIYTSMNILFIMLYTKDKAEKKDNLIQRSKIGENTKKLFGSIAVLSCNARKEWQVSYPYYAMNESLFVSNKLEVKKIPGIILFQPFWKQSIVINIKIPGSLV